MEASVYSIPLCEENTHYRYTFIVLGNLKNQPLFSSWFMYYLCNYLFTPSYVLFKLLLLLLLLLFMTILNHHVNILFISLLFEHIQIQFSANYNSLQMVQIPIEWQFQQGDWSEKSKYLSWKSV